VLNQFKRPQITAWLEWEDVFTLYKCQFGDPYAPVSIPGDATVSFSLAISLIFTEMAARYGHEWLGNADECRLVMHYGTLAMAAHSYGWHEPIIAVRVTA